MTKETLLYYLYGFETTYNAKLFINKFIRERIEFSNVFSNTHIIAELVKMKTLFSEIQREELKKLQYVKINSILSRFKSQLKQKYFSIGIELAEKSIDIIHFVIPYIDTKIDVLKNISSNDLDVGFINKQFELTDNISNENIAQSSDVKSIIKEMSKDVLTREETCEYLKISNRKLTTLINRNAINPVTTTCKPYTFAKKELERYVNQNIES